MEINNLTYGNKTATNVFIRLILEGTEPDSGGFLYYQVKTALGVVCEEGNVPFTSAWVDTWDGSRGAVNDLLTAEKPYIVESV